MGAPKQILNLFPRSVPDRWWVYLVGRVDGSFKVGITRRPRQRMNQHRLAGGMTWCHLVGHGRHGFAYCTERKAMKAFAELGQRRGRTEVFAGIDKVLALKTVRAIADEQRAVWLDVERKESIRIAELKAWDAFKAFWPSFKATGNFPAPATPTPEAA